MDFSMMLRSFVRLETHRLQTGISGYAAKVNIIREAIRLYSQRDVNTPHLAALPYLT